MRGIRVLWLFVVLALAPSAASAVTLDQVVALRKAGVTDAVILALIERDRTVFTIQPEQIVELKRDGLSEALIIAMLKTAQAADESARESSYMSSINTAVLGPAPDLVIVGHGPERPNTYHADGFFTNSLAGPLIIPPYFGSGVPYSRPHERPYTSFDRRASIGPRANRWTEPRELCYAQVTSSASAGNSMTYVTECPAVLQPRRVR